MKRLALIAGLACGCAGDTIPIGDGPDAIPPRCEMSIDTVMPVEPLVGDTIDVDASIVELSTSGRQGFQFEVIGPDDRARAVAPRFPEDTSRVEFVADIVGTYTVTLFGSVGGAQCQSDSLSVFVAEPGAPAVRYRFRFVPPPDRGPPQDEVFDIPAAGTEPSYPVGVVGLDDGVEVAGTVRGAAPLAAYLRFVAFDGRAVEAFSDDTGAFGLRLVAGAYDVLVVPQSGAEPPVVIPDVIAAQDLDLIVPGGDAVTGTVVDGAGQPVVGARVSLRVGGVPSTIATTDAGGGFAVLGHTGAATAVIVTPPAGSGLPRLELDEAAGLTATTTEALTIAYGTALTSRPLSVPVVDTDGTTPLPDALVTLIMRPVAAAGTVTPAGGAALAAGGSDRITAEADGAGTISVVVPEAVYDVVVRSNAGPTLRAVDLRAGEPAPADLALTPPAHLDGRVVAGDTDIEGAVVRAVPRGLLAAESAAAVAVTGADGRYRLDVIAGGDYELVVEPVASFARAVVAGVIAPAAGDAAAVDDIAVAPAVRVFGAVSIAPQTQVPGVTVQVFCTACTGTAAAIPLAEGITDNRGDFVVWPPAPTPGGS